MQNGFSPLTGIHGFDTETAVESLDPFDGDLNTFQPPNGDSWL
jgi:hypothetical protein